MKEFACRKCGSAELFIKLNGNQTGLYCSECGAWQKWLNKDEKRLAENWIEYIHNQKEESNKPMTVEVVKQMIYSSALGCNDNNTQKELFYIIDMIDKFGVKI